ncbi:MAG TPA: FecR domain-containing protein [Polyangiaceae bacterium]|nr:FecR domain-containing protein [Polyangiaceae bacterium]
MSTFGIQQRALLGSLLLSLLSWPLVSCHGRSQAPLVFTVGDIQAVHTEVTVSKRPVQGEQRLSDGDSVATGPDGRARLRLDDGTIVAVDAATRFTLHGSKLELESGRVFVQGGAAARTEVTLRGASTTVASSAAAFDSQSPQAKVYCAQGELMLNAAGSQLRVSSGETATLDGKDNRVAPEKAFEDWTGGLAVPWTSPLGERSAIPSARAINDRSDPGTDLVIRAQKVAVDIDGELAVTKTRTTYFNGGSSSQHAKLQLSLPSGAIVRGVTRTIGGNTSSATLQAARESGATGAALEFAGGGWLSGDLGSVPAGQTLDFELEYAEWLPTRGDRAAYRFPMAASESKGIVGELSVDVDVSRSKSPFLTASASSTVKDGVVHYRQADLRPTGDLVVELSPNVVRRNTARAYVVSAPRANEDPFVMIRTEVPERSEAGVTLAVVIDSSMSVGSAALETERAVVDAIVEGLGPRDSLVVLAADQTVRAMGPTTPTAVSPAVRGQVRAALGSLRAGGASNVGSALQQAADILDSPSRGELAGSGMVVYIGDGRPSVGEPDAEHIRRLIGRRVGGLPRLGAVAVGASADRWMLAKLVTGVGAVYEVGDRADAARAGAKLLADALQPTLRDVELDLGSTVDRIYPREGRAVLAGSTVTVLGRLRGKLPTHVGFRFRDGSKLVQESRPVYRTVAPHGQDILKRWVTARIEDVATRGEGVEPAIVLAVENQLLTPWTSWFFPQETGSESLAHRLLDLSPLYDTPFATQADDTVVTGSTLLEPPRTFGGGVSLREAAEAAVRRVLMSAAGAVRACRDARAATRPEISREFSLDLSINGDGHATRVHVELVGNRGGDRVLERCIEGVVKSLPFFAAGAVVNVRQELTVPEGRSSRRTQCSAASKVSLPLRKSIWRARSSVSRERFSDAYIAAARACELPTWTDRRALLLLYLEGNPDLEAWLQMATALEQAGETDAAAFLRRETLRRVTSFEQLQRLSSLLTRDEPKIDDELNKAYKQAESDTERLAVTRRFLRLAPHNGLARRRLLSLLEALGQKEALIAEIENLRGEPVADAGLLAQGASALRRIGQDAEGRRAFGELIERAPRDPWTLAYVGDRLRAEGMFDEAGAAYDSLARALPNDAAVALRLALSHAGAGRLDVSTRLLDRIAQTGGRGDDGRLGELASITQAVLLAGARGGTDAEIDAELDRRLLRTALPDVQSIVMVQSPPSDDPIQVSVVRAKGEKVAQSADLDARELGVAAIRIERGDGTARISLKRTLELGPSRPARAKVAALILNRESNEPRLVTKEVEVSADGKSVVLEFDGEAFL